MTFILAASGKKQSGKDTLLTGLTPYLESKGWVRYYSFADELKNFLINGLGLRREQVFGTNEQKNELTTYSWGLLPRLIRWEWGGFYVKDKQGNDTQFNPSTPLNSFADLEAWHDAHVHPGSILINLKTGFMTGRELMQVFGTDIMRRMFGDRVWVNALTRSIEKDKPAVAIIPDMRFPSEFVPIHEYGGYVIRLMRDVSEGDVHPSEVALDNWEWEKYDRVLVIPSDATIESCRQMSTDWLEKQMNKDKK